MLDKDLSEVTFVVNCNPFHVSFTEFLDYKDKSLAFAIYGAYQVHSFPIAILPMPTSHRNAKEEFLLCYNGRSRNNTIPVFSACSSLLYTCHMLLSFFHLLTLLLLSLCLVIAQPFSLSPFFNTPFHYRPPLLPSYGVSNLAFAQGQLCLYRIWSLCQFGRKKNASGRSSLDQTPSSLL